MTAKHLLDQIVRGLDGVTPGPWSWTIFDHSCAALGVGNDPGCGTPHVLSISPCKSCAARAEQWEWGRCTTPSEADAMHIARCSPDTIREIAAYVSDLEEKYAEAEDILKERDDRLALVDRIADLIGLPHDQELDHVAFELWFSAAEARATAAEATVTALQEALAKAAEALEPFMERAKRFDEIPGVYLCHDNVELWQDGNWRCDLTVADLRRARTALSQIRSEK